MYSTRVIERTVEEFERQTRMRLKRTEISAVEDRSAQLCSIVQSDGKGLTRSLTADETEFIAHERILSRLDWHYWAARYGTLEYDGSSGGGIGTLTDPWESQNILLRKIAEIQEEQFDAYRAGEPVDGILIADHKARQVGHTALVRQLHLHRVTVVPHTRAAAISVDDGKISEIYRRDKTVYDNLPWYMRPDIEFDVKDQHITWAKLKSRMVYMTSNMKSSLGQSMQFDIAHCTEVSEYPYPKMLEVDFFPTLPQGPNTLCVLESRANGRVNWWKDFSEDVRLGHKARWRYCFCPWYAEPKKYRRQPYQNWIPLETTTMHADLCSKSSPEFFGGRRVELSREQMYWWETTREEYRSAGSLNLFLSNYCATPQESFQHSGTSAFDTELLEEMRLIAENKPCFRYEIETGIKKVA